MPKKRNRSFRNVFFWISAGVLIILLWSLLQNPNVARKDVTFTQFMDQVEQGNVEEATIADSELRGKYKDGGAFRTILPAQYDDLIKVLRLNKVNIIVKNTARNGWLSLLFSWFPIILLILFWVFFMRQMQAGGNKAMSFGKSRAKLFSGLAKKVTFKDVAGVDEAQEELSEIIEFLKDPQRFQKLGGRIPKGVLLVGAPGTGKTLLARAVAGEADVPFFSISGSDFVEMFVGVGASRVRDLFDQGKKHAPCLIFIDEIDAVGRQRGAGLGGGHDEREQTLNQLLVEMDGFNTSDGVILMAATNRPDVLDRALLRPGRFDRQVVVAHPDIVGREAILQIHIRNNNLPLAEDVIVKTLARGTPGFSGADLANMVNEAALLAARRSRDKVTMQDFEDAKDRVLMGPERRSLAISNEEKRLTAYHEAGHVLVGRLTPHTDPIHKATIIPRGPALGITSWLPEEDRHNVTKSYCIGMLRMAMGGRAAEEVVFNEFSSGAAGDLNTATQRAHAMVCEWGMSDLGPINFGSNNEVFLGRDFVKERSFSDETAAAVDNEIHKLLKDAYAEAKTIVLKRREILEALADELVERETLEADDIDEIIRRMGGKDLLPPKRPRKHEPSGREAVVVAPAPGDAPDITPAAEDIPGDIVPGTA